LYIHNSSKETISEHYLHKIKRLTS